jgi:hypothetical protein
VVEVVEPAEVVVDDFSSATSGAAEVESCEKRVEYANTLPLMSRESNTIDANACAVLFATFIFLRWYIGLGRR